MNHKQTSSLNDEIEQKLAEMNLSDHVTAAISESVAKLNAEGVVPGLSVGEKAPNFRLRNQHGREVTLFEELAKGPVVLKFIRGEWCPICNTEMGALRRVQSQLKELGARLLVIHPQKLEQGWTLGVRHAFDFDILSDDKQEVIRKFGLQFTLPPSMQKAYMALGLNLPSHTADRSWNLPVPATFILDGEGFVRASHVDMNYLKRMEPALMLEVIRSLK